MTSQVTTEKGAMGPPRQPPPLPQKRVQRLLPNVRYCINTGRLYAPAPEDGIIYSRYLILAYGVVPPKDDFDTDDDMKPVDPASIICTCSCCTPANNVYPVTRKTIAAYAHTVPPTPVDESNEEWAKPLPAPSVNWSTRSTPAELLLRWSDVKGDVADVSYYEIYSYREILSNNDYKKNPWNRLTIEKNRTLKLKNFKHGGLYHYIVRSVDVYDRHSPFSKAASLFLPVT